MASNQETARTVGERIAQARREAGLTQMALAERLRVRLWLVDQYETGGRDVPLDRLEGISEAPGRPTSWVLQEQQGYETSALIEQQGRLLGEREGELARQVGRAA